MSLLSASGKEAIADWIETTLLARGSHMSHDQLAAVAGDEIQAGEHQVGLALGVLAARAKVLGDAYPFEPLDVAVKVRPALTLSPYALLLLLTPGSPARVLLNPGPTDESAALFERAVAAAMRALLGAGSSALRFGWPSDEGRPPEFNLAIGWLAGKMGVDLGTGYRQPKRKDGGVDVIAWRPFPDGRKGFPIWLVQCTVQESIVGKASDIDLRIWSSWLGFDTDPVAALAVPGTIAKKTDWDEVALRCVALDRMRLAGLLHGSGLEAIAGGSAFVSEQLDLLQSHLRGAGGWQ